MRSETKIQRATLTQRHP